MHRLEPARGDAVLDAMPAEAEREQLAPLHDAVLGVRQRGDRAVDGAFAGHMPVKAPRGGSSPPSVA
jgi:hypothetical protein